MAAQTLVEYYVEREDTVSENWVGIAIEVGKFILYSIRTGKTTVTATVVLNAQPLSHRPATL